MSEPLQRELSGVEIGAKAASYAPGWIGLMGQLVNAGLGIYNNYRNQQLSQQQNAWSRNMWKQANAYNTPANQVNRLAAAGINPALAFSNGGLTNEAQSAPAMVSSRNMPVQFDPLMAAQIDLMQAQAKEHRANAIESGWRSNAIEIQNAISNMTKEAYEKANENGLFEKSIFAGMDKAVSDAGISKQEYAELAWNTALLFGSSVTSSMSSGVSLNGKVGFHFDQEQFNNIKSNFVGGIALEKKMQELNDKMLELQNQRYDKDVDIWTSINKAADDGELWAQIARAGLFILEQLGGINLGISANLSPKPRVGKKD